MQPANPPIIEVAEEDLVVAKEVEGKVGDGGFNKPDRRSSLTSFDGSSIWIWVYGWSLTIINVWKRRIMAKRNSHSFIKLQKEIERKKKAKEKLSRRQGKKDQVIDDVDEQKDPDWSNDWIWNHKFRWKEMNLQIIILCNLENEKDYAKHSSFYRCQVKFIWNSWDLILQISRANSDLLWRFRFIWVSVTQAILMYCVANHNRMRAIG